MTDAEGSLEGLNFLIQDYCLSLAAYSGVWVVVQVLSRAVER